MSDSTEQILPVYAERVAVLRRRVATQVVRAVRTTRRREQLIDETLTREHVVVERVPIGLMVEAVPPIREEGGTTILPVVEEVVVVQRKLMLKEEIRIRRVTVEHRHVETVTLEEQDATVSRRSVAATGQTQPQTQTQTEGQTSMTAETIVAVYDTAAHAEAAIRDLRAANVPESAISHHAENGTPTEARPGFWSSLFGEEADTGAAYAGTSVVSVTLPEQDIAAVTDILERHNPVDIDDRAASARSAAPMPAPAAARGGDSIQLAEERLSVGKRLVSGGGARIRRFVVETPVEQQVTLHDETVTVDRRPVTDPRPAGNADFTDKTIEMTESREEAVVAKTAYVTEEVSLRKDVRDRVETVRDTVRREDVEIEQIPGTAAKI